MSRPPSRSSHAIRSRRIGDARAGATEFTCTHDGWNRLVKVEADSGGGDVPRTENQYNGLNWRTVHRADTDADGDLDEERVMFYNASWQMVEEDIYEGWSIGSPGSVDERRAYFWGARYIDDLIQTLVDGQFGASPDGDYEDVSGGNDAWHFHLTDAQFSTVMVMDRAGNPVERVTYDAYGKATHHDDKDVDGDGDFDSTDRGFVTALVPTFGSSVAITSGSYNADCDLNRDGVLNITDLGLMGVSYVAALPKGELSLPVQILCHGDSPAITACPHAAARQR